MFKRFFYLKYFAFCFLFFFDMLPCNNFFRNGQACPEAPPLSDARGIVVATKLLEFSESLSNAYNASIIESGDSYLLIFRHDTTNKWCNHCKYTERQLKMVHITKDFEQASPITTIMPTQGVKEDPRAHFWQGKIFVTCNGDVQKPVHVRQPPKSLGTGKAYYLHLKCLGEKTLVKPQGPHIHLHPVERKLFLAKLNVKKALLNDSTQIPSGGIHLAAVEKNWMPFEYPEGNGSLYYIYSTFPHKIISVGNLNNPKSSKNCATITKDVYSIWPKETWGEIRGGSPARLVDGVYLTFFHAKKYNPKDQCHYYVMGAYIFQAHPPFQILALTPEPIFFNDIYTTKQLRKNLYTLYPAGFVVEKKEEKTLLHVSCGENDTSIRIVSIDKDALFTSMVAAPSINSIPSQFD